MKNSKLLIVIFLVLLVITAGYLFLTRTNRPLPSSNSVEKSEEITTMVSGEFIKGQKTPDVTFTDFDGNRHSLSDFDGRAVVLDFWAAWCPFCVAEMPLLQAAQDKYKDELIMVGVHRGDTERKDLGLKFARERGVTYLLASDNGALYNAAGGFGMPVAVFIDKNGVVQEIKSGPKTQEEIEKKIGQLVN